MAIPRPSAGKPQDPRDRNQVDAGPIISPPAFPEVGQPDLAKFRPGKYAGKTIRAGK